MPISSVQRTADSFRIAFAGPLDEKQERISDLTRAFCRVASEVPGVEGVIYGDGPDRASVRRILANEGQGLRVRLAGEPPTGELQKRLLETDAIVALSDCGDLTTSVRVGMACGCVPVRMRTQTATNEFGEDDAPGLRVDDRKENFVDAVRLLAADRELWEKLSANARDFAALHLSEAQSTASWAELLKGLETKGGPRRPIGIPRRIDLPPVNPSLVSDDVRDLGAPVTSRIYRRSRMFAGLVKQHVLGRRAPEPIEKRIERVQLREAVIITVSGGLANQMMCYKGARYLAVLKGATLILDATRYAGQEDSVRNFQLFSYDTRHDLIIHSTEVLDHIRASNDVEFIARETIPDAWGDEADGFVDHLVSRRIVHGDFWLANFVRQRADEYFQQAGLLSELTLNHESCFDETNNNFLKLIQQSANPVAIHVRRGDYATHDGNLLLNPDYYNASIKSVEERLSDPSLFVFSDDIAWCRQNLVATAPLHFVDANDERHAYRDMYLASQCHHFILSNESTFSHQVVQLSPTRAGRIVITSTWDDLVRNTHAGRK